MTDIFIHTNVNLTPDSFEPYKNGQLTVVCHDLTRQDPFYLTWKCRDLMKRQRDMYDIFMYLEDDILVPKQAIAYWLKHGETLVQHNYNLGFLRIEVKDGQEYVTDFMRNQRLSKTHVCDNNTYVINDINPYCAFWIYNRAEFGRFVEHAYWDPKNIVGYGIREKSAVGLHGTQTNWYQGTMIPLRDGQLDPDCRIYHLPNNYVATQEYFAVVKFGDLFKPAK